ncbi:hypothetical protein BCR43DRAFT_483390 [Syncephalastrum racemosum]|uniref:SET domain-containing protein n=1 Tax=Syncephalastrum racemosum TaxID=13706 RepID=A0A1X2HV95_SYNRA|nr:hypothetical protein BCR43DRAFT_483390 [Syncephalastrum racemosum]
MTEASAMLNPLNACPAPALHDATNRLEAIRLEVGAKTGEKPQSAVNLDVVGAPLEESIQNQQSSPGEYCWMDNDTPLSTLPSSPSLSSTDPTIQDGAVPPQIEVVTTTPLSACSSSLAKLNPASRKRVNDTPPKPHKPQKTRYIPRRSPRKQDPTPSDALQSQKKRPCQPQRKPEQPVPLTPPKQKEISPPKRDIEPMSVPSSPDSHTQRLKGRKDFLVAGLYSSFFKQPSNKALPRASKRKQLRKPFVLPLPIHQGATLFDNQIEFQVPRDIMQDHLLGHIRPPLEQPRFTRIKSNIFVERRRLKESQPVVCQCIPPQTAGLVVEKDVSIGKMLFFECNPDACPCRDQCSNQRFRRGDRAAKTEVFPTQKRGWGLRTENDIEEGRLIIEYIGEIISTQECKKRMDALYIDQQNFYFLEYNKGEVIDAGQKGSDARFINHSCDPNCHIEKWIVNGEPRVGVFASKFIPAKSELFYDYNFSTFGDIHQQCNCGADKCRGFIGKRPAEARKSSRNV